MLRGAVARRYAHAMFELALEGNMLDSLESDLKGVLEIIESNPELKRIIYHPQVTSKDKKDLVGNIFSDYISPVAKNSLFFLIDRRRESFLGDIVAAFVLLANQHRNIVEVHVTSAIEMNEKEQKSLAKVLDKLAGKKVQPEYAVDPSLIGGVVVRIGDRVIDGSVKTRLATLKDRLIQNQVN
ncbi:ATP synthase F1, delta subunit [Desulfofarcimen acetoxidans DSM 771]|jgi:F-type H+-transporting ATPase subunit delta|uniref:ATP synthase subunit delta n=1 Tax=Desulfofarcimen acetoxidans (strain ATCC 49208 / DSM 771 / KCTC 5769 / VKM B-1644 / 5575) TaxID=485916 RepID=C8VZ91_DESAS|nr:F0F1 ATP synthase subunit delta [Desulfofarcimen acetoxidans]ACV64836.1 ATP synthase F1, delta subunit [Desulfofarcimen acetoxidans DSM 771]